MRSRSPFLAITSLATALAACSDSPDLPHVIVISLDTTRADYLGCYGNQGVRTPHIDRLASEGVLFRDATGAAPTTLAAHTSILTGTYPHAHGVVRNGFLVPEANEMLAETLDDAGFRTAGFLGSFALHSSFEFHQGFQFFDEKLDLSYQELKYDQEQRRAEQVTDAVLRYVDGAPDGPLFLFAHYFDAHAPYDPPPPYDTMYTRPDAPRGIGLRGRARAARAHHRRLLDEELAAVAEHGLSKELLAKADGEPMAGDADRAALYAGEVSYMDEHVGRLLDSLRERGILDDAIVVLTGDHGETFWEHGDYWNHGLCVYQTSIHVPLIVRLPNREHAGRVVDLPVSSVDVFPTVLELLGLPVSPEVEGESLVGLFSTDDPAGRLVFSEGTQPRDARFESARVWGNERKAKAVRRGSWKYVYTPYLDYEELYDLATDPNERTNLLANPDDSSRGIRDSLRAELDSWSAGRTPHRSSYNPSGSEEVIRRLSELGYGGEGR